MILEKEYFSFLLKKSELFLVSELKAEHFSTKLTRDIFTAIEYLMTKENSYSFPTIIHHFEKMNQDVQTYYEYLSEVIEFDPPTTAESAFRHTEKEILEAYATRKTYEIGQMLANGKIDRLQALKELESLDNLNKPKQDGRINKSLIELYNDFESRTGDILGESTGFKEIDATISGFRPGKFIVIGARPSVGKTAFALNLLHGSTVQNKNPKIHSVLFSLEMTHIELLERLVTMDGFIDGRRAKAAGKVFTHEEWERYTEATGRINAVQDNIRVYEAAGMNVKWIRNVIKQEKRENPDKLVVVYIDYLQLIQGNTKTNNRAQEVGEISRELKRITTQEKCCIVCLSQLNRAVENRQDKRPLMNDLRESGDIEQDADTIALLYREDYYDKEEDNTIEISFQKNRDGESHKTINLKYLKNCQRMMEG